MAGGGQIHSKEDGVAGTGHMELMVVVGLSGAA